MVTMQRYHALANEGDSTMYTYQLLLYHIISLSHTLSSRTALNFFLPQLVLPIMKSGSVTLLTSI
jgi:hypothetical protein